MKPQLLKVFTSHAHSFSARNDLKPDVNNHWHYHPEIELVYFNKGRGKQFVGDHIGTFEPGDLVLVGANLPHFWQFDKDQLEVDVSVLHFSEHLFGETFMNLPENRFLKILADEAKRGMYVGGQHSALMGWQMQQVVNEDGGKRILLLLEILLQIQQCTAVTFLTTIGFIAAFPEAEKDRIHAIYNYTIHHFRKKITLQEIAAVAHVSPHSFCKYFKARSKKTNQQFVNEIRVGHACHLLLETGLNVKEICYESGFYNFASFHKFFRLKTGLSPLAYQKTFSNKR